VERCGKPTSKPSWKPRTGTPGPRLKPPILPRSPPSMRPRQSPHPVASATARPERINSGSAGDSVTRPTDWHHNNDRRREAVPVPGPAKSFRQRAIMALTTAASARRDSQVRFPRCRFPRRLASHSSADPQSGSIFEPGPRSNSNLSQMAIPFRNLLSRLKRPNLLHDARRPKGPSAGLAASQLSDHPCPLRESRSRDATAKRAPPFGRAAVPYRPARSHREMLARLGIVFAERAAACCSPIRIAVEAEEPVAPAVFSDHRNRLSQGIGVTQRREAHTSLRATGSRRVGSGN
jgi:hypothetical protein